MKWLVVFVYVFFFQQKTAYEMLISDWSSDVCSSDLGSRTANMPSGPTSPTAQPVIMASNWFPAFRQASNAARSVSCVTSAQKSATPGGKIGSASCRERVSQYV